MSASFPGWKRPYSGSVSIRVNGVLCYPAVYPQGSRGINTSSFESSRLFSNRETNHVNRLYVPLNIIH